jgi:hypothetical protein
MVQAMRARFSGFAMRDGADVGESGLGVCKVAK